MVSCKKKKCLPLVYVAMGHQEWLEPSRYTRTEE